MSRLKVRRTGVTVVGVVALVLGAVGCSSSGSSGDHGGSSDGGFSLGRLTVVAGAAPGGSEDTLLRGMQQGLSKALGVTVVAQNVPGADGNTGAEQVLEKGSDCSQVLVVNIPALLTGFQDSGLPFKASDFTSLVGVLHDYGDIRVQNDAKWKTFAEFIADAKANPGKISISVQSVDSSNGNGITNLEKVAGVKFNVVPFGGSGSKARDALLAGSVDANASNVFNGQSIATKTRVLAVQQPENKWPDLTNKAPTMSAALGKTVPDAQTIYGFAASTKCATQHKSDFDAIEKALETASKDSAFVANLAKLDEADSLGILNSAQFHTAIVEQGKLFNADPIS